MATSELPTTNFRDLGGHRAGTGVVHERLLMRSDAVVGLAADERRALADLSLNTAIDLREPVERRLDPAELGADVALVELPLLGGVRVAEDQSLADLYAAILERRGPRMVEVIRALAAAEALPALYFCSAGKDRTGLVTALILSAIGVADTDIADDYAVTAVHLQGDFRTRVESRAHAAGISEQAMASKLGAPRELMLRVLAGLRERHGSPAGYLEHHGLPAEDRDALRAALVAPDG